MALVNIKFKRPECCKMCFIVINNIVYKGYRIEIGDNKINMWKATIVDNKDYKINDYNEYIHIKNNHFWIYFNKNYLY